MIYINRLIPPRYPQNARTVTASQTMSLLMYLNLRIQTEVVDNICLKRLC